MRRHPKDQLDLWCEWWANERRKLLGVNVRLEPRERLGKLNCTLGQILDEKVGAGAHSVRIGPNGHVNQNWPEVYTGMVLDIHRVVITMQYNWRVVMDMHYVVQYVHVREKAMMLHIKTGEYWCRVDNAKKYLARGLGIDNACSV